MKTKKEIVERQIELQEQMQRAGLNVVECGNCGTVLLHETGDEDIDCFCGTRNLSDCPDLYYSGIENNEEFKEEITRVEFYMATYQPYEGDEQPYKEVLAVFVDDVEEVVNGEKHLGCYAHLGQHSTCAESFLAENCRKATKGEYQELFNELTFLVGYNLEVI